ncbi:hypothetical protein LZ318_25945 [Saccharopolyspora indica]|uniref:hypothetical protein n=1 Tax=Saccharopolyspora indica TaxID=1229659 RepID=UPI0022EA6BBE|nr:hypothetical protein [Saccharopolyspora indica]MDA3646651.1 hypothetical protein [Saccharopolyspora indica]
MHGKGKFTFVAVAVGFAGFIGFLADSLSVLDWFTGSTDAATTSPAAPPTEEPGMSAQPSASATPVAQFRFGEPEEVAWSVTDTACGNVNEINWDDLGSSPAADPGEADFSYGRSDCSNASFHATHGGLVPPGTALDAMSCRSAAMAGTLPIWVDSDEVNELGLVPGAAICIVTDQKRVVRAEIENVTPDSPRSPSLRGRAKIWILE